MRQGSELFAFERYMTFRKSGGNHCQLNVLPVSAAAAASARADVQRLAHDHGVPLQPLDGPSKVSHHFWTLQYVPRGYNLKDACSLCLQPHTADFNSMSRAYLCLWFSVWGQGVDA